MPFSLSVTVLETEQRDDAHTEQFSVGSEHPETQERNKFLSTSRLLGKDV